ncbi:MAG TPA: prolyl oligopeptidase family serine peptidase [Steroidobacteraceae bacterium]|nr:prolyl oligopeptidase family serine peptidase [Steroidobacteraceae bacterium]
MRSFGAHLCAAVAAALLAACGSADSPTATESPSTARGTLVQDPPLRIASLDAATLQAELNGTATGAQLLQLAGAPTCGVDFYYIEYWTVGGHNERTNASGALMLPTGSGAKCSGKRPIVLYAHGTQSLRTANIADVTDPNNTEGVLIAAMFAAQGYIVVAPNYAGYDISTLPYHPYLNADQQSADMIDALAASRTALPQSFTPATSDSGELFITGYSQGGYVAMATHRALQEAGETVTASAPMSGPYALEAFGDAVFFGNVNIGSTVFTPLITTSYQNSYHNLYVATTDVYDPTYATGIETVLPSTLPLSDLFTTGKLPQTALFNSTTPVTGIPQLDAELAVPANPLFALGFGNPSLVNNNFRAAYAIDAAQHPDGAVPTPQAGVPTAASPQHPLRQDFKLNDMRNWAPQAPMLMCGGDQDPTVFFSVNTQTMQAYWAALPQGLVSVLDVNAAVTGADSPQVAALKTAFQQTLGQIAAGGGQQAVVQAYHSTVAPFCSAAARGLFDALKMPGE